MERKTLRTILNEIGYSKDMVKSILHGRARPSYERMIELNHKHGIPFTAWIDIKSYINNNKTKKVMEG